MHHDYTILLCNQTFQVCVSLSRQWNDMTSLYDTMKLDLCLIKDAHLMVKEQRSYL